MCPTVTPAHVGDRVERSGRPVERDAEVAGPLARAGAGGALRGQRAAREQERGGGAGGATPSCVAGERKMKYTAPMMQSAAQR